MVESRETLGAQLLAGLVGDFVTVESKIPEISKRNRKYRQAWALVEISRGVAPLSSFACRWPDWEVGSVLNDPEVALLIEEIGERPELVSLGQRRLATKTLNAALEVISARLEPSECGIHHARDVAELALKIDGALAKSSKEATPRKKRSLRLLGGVCTILSPEHPDGTEVVVRDAKDACAVFVAMRCVNEREFHDVWNCLSECLFVGSIELEGW